MANGQPNPTGTGRYCPPRICWCGDCAWYVPIPEPDYTRLREAAERASAKQRRSWATREEPTWLDEL
jgi:hypothetical protein